MITHLVIDLHYTEDECNTCFAGTQQECIEFASKQTPYFMYRVVPMTNQELKLHNEEV